MNLSRSPSTDGLQFAASNSITKQAENVYKPVHFFLFVFVITWASEFTAAYFSYQKDMTGIAMLCMLPGLFAPFIGALIMIRGPQNKWLRQDYWARLGLKKIKLSYLPAILLIMPFALFLATALSLLFGQSADQFRFSSGFSIVAGQVWLSLLIAFLAPAFEELGWRGYGVDSLRSRFSFAKTTLLFGVLWALWHLPLFFVNGYYNHELWETSIVYVINWVAQIFVAALLLNWVYYKNNRSIAATILFHFMFVLFSELFQTEQFTKCIITIILLGISSVLILRDKEFFLRS